MRDRLILLIAGSYEIGFGKGLSSTGPIDGSHRNGMAIDTYHSWNGKPEFCSGVMGYEDILKLKNHIEEWISMRDKELLK